MTHDDALLCLLASDIAPPHVTTDAARSHVADCADCWNTLASIHHHVTGISPPEAARIEMSLMCEHVHRILPILVDLDANALAAAHPHAAAHLGTCRDCRERFAELVRFSRYEAATPQTSLRVTILVRRGVAAFIELTGTIVAEMPALVPEPARGSSTVDPGRQGASQVRIATDETELALAVEAEGGDRVRLTVEAALQVPATLTLRTEGHLVAGQPLLPGAPAVLRSIPPGSYRLEIRANEVCNVEVEVTASG